ncbi:hypothetical protein [Chitinophaga sp. LS1]|uniref:hypothetical protein n=1 Tax=Chitinophaga sp. LS1 TaxID=3051176 RepID=UPI002AAB6CDE|nr:hypothetical protein [Chitinophaga sp. LS1]WPV65408.1 hypothetical protein QQL36_26765 [Chitinophaga sp. LS1]
MDTREIAQEILKATTLHSQGSILTGLTENSRPQGIEKMKQAEQNLIDILEKFRLQIIDEIKAE